MPKIASTPVTFRMPRSRLMSPWPITRATRTCGPLPPRFWTRSTSLLLLQLPLPSLPLSLLPAYVGRHSAVFPEDTARISREGIERAEAIAAGIMENRRHERVNQILEEEIERLQSSTAKRTGRAYLSVIEGGTASFAPLRADFCMIKINRKWAVVTCLMALLIWGNSLVPGSGSGSLSLTVMEAIRDFLRGVGLPYEWVTNFVVRKCAHFSEYMVLGILATHAFDFEGRRTFDVLLPTAVFLLLIPSIDETIQLFVPGRAGMITDVMIDCCGAATGVVLRYLLRSLMCAKKAA